MSRAINALASDGFVSKDADGWVLTEMGVEEALRLRERRAEVLPRVWTPSLPLSTRCRRLKEKRRLQSLIGQKATLTPEAK